MSVFYTHKSFDLFLSTVSMSWCATLARLSWAVCSYSGIFLFLEYAFSSIFLILVCVWLQRFKVWFWEGLSVSVRMYVQCTHTYICMCMRVYKPLLYMCTRMYVIMLCSVYTYVQILVRWSVKQYTCVCMYAHACVYTYTHAYILCYWQVQAYIHTLAHTYSYIQILIDHA